MTVLLVGTDYEENLGLAMVAASLTRAGHAVEVVAFNEASELERVAQRVVSRTPNLVGLGIQFQHRALDFFELGRRLRCLGFRGHITCGGQYPTMAFGDLLAHEAFLDSVALHEAEHTIVELARAVDRSEPLSTVSGLAFRDANDRVVKTSPRPMTADLDALPFAHRYREHSRHLKIPFIPISASRGCWGSCAFCSITTTYRTARAQARTPLCKAVDKPVVLHRGHRSAWGQLRLDHPPEKTVQRVRFLSQHSRFHSL